MGLSDCIFFLGVMGGWKGFGVISEIRFLTVAVRQRSGAYTSAIL